MQALPCYQEKFLSGGINHTCCDWADTKKNATAFLKNEVALITALYSYKC